MLISIVIIVSIVLLAILLRKPIGYLVMKIFSPFTDKFRDGDLSTLESGEMVFIIVVLGCIIVTAVLFSLIIQDELRQEKGSKTV